MGMSLFEKSLINELKGIRKELEKLNQRKNVTTLAPIHVDAKSISDEIEGFIKRERHQAPES